MKNIKAIAFIDKKDKNIPSIGLLEKDTFSLKPNYIDKKNGYYNELIIYQVALPCKIIYLSICLSSVLYVK